MTTMLVEPFAPWLRELSQASVQTPERSGPFIPPADLLVGDDGVRVYMDVPGLRVEDLEIELENDALAVRGERPFPYGNEAGTPRARRIERGFGRFERSLRVPGGLDPDAIEASLADGVLSLRIPAPQTPRAKRIEIKADGNGSNRSRRQGKGEGAQQESGDSAQEGASG